MTNPSRRVSTCATSLALALSTSLVAASPEPEILKAAGRGHPWVSFGDGRALASPAGRLPLAGVLGSEPRALAAGDLDEDGMPDLVIALATPDGRGRLLVHRGNVDALYPNSAEALARRSRDAFSAEPFLEASRVVELSAPPDFAVVADLDADGHLDVAVAARGGRSIQVYAGDGLGSVLASGSVEVAGAITALASADVNRRDGLDDLLVGAVEAGHGARLLVYEGPRGAAAAEPESIPLAAPAVALATGRLSGGSEIDVAVAAGRDLVVVHGRDRRMGLDAERRAEVRPARVDRRAFPFTIASLAVGDLVAGDAARGDEVALLSADGTVHFLDAERHDVREAVVVSGAVSEKSAAVAPLFLASKLSSLPADDLLVLDVTRTRLSIVTPEVAADFRDPVARVRATASHRLAATFDSAHSTGSAAEVVAALPMRLNADAISDLVLLVRGSPSPIFVVSRPAATFTVNVSTDAVDCDVTDGICAAGPLVNNVCTGPCTFRAAVMQANALGGANTIGFAIPGAGIPVLDVTQQLGGAGTVPFTPMTLDATTQQPAGRVQMPGPFSVQGGNSVVRGFILTGGPAGGGAYLTLSVAGNDIVEGNLIGTDTAGTAPGTQNGPAPGIYALDVPDLTIGGTVAAARNVISGNPGDAVQVYAPGLVLRGNYIGTDVTGTAVVRNGGAGVNIADINVTIGGTAAGAGNVISGNGTTTPNVQQGIYLNNASGLLVQGNWIGTNAAGTAALPNVDGGLFIIGGSATIGGTTPAARNVISGNSTHGVSIIGDGTLVQGNYIGTAAGGGSAVANAGRGVQVASNGGSTIGGASSGNVISGNLLGGVRSSGPNVIAGNLIGTNASGTAAVPNTGPGVELIGSIPSVVLGPGNVISGNTGSGVLVDFGSVVKGNLIGLNAAGTAAVANGENGILQETVTVSTVEIGGVTAADRNVISGNTGHGFLMRSGQSLTRGNYVGTNAAGTAAIGNGGDGIRIESNTLPGTTVVGGVGAGEGNVIAGNGGAGILLSGTLVSMRGNSLYANGGLGIDLAPGGATGVTPNDGCDDDFGPNALQNFPVLTSSASSVGQGAATTVQGTLNAAASTAYTIDLYSSDSCDPSGFGEGRTYLGSTQVAATPGCTATIAATVPASVQGGLRITATATDPFGNTSELSACSTPTIQYGNLNNDAVLDIFDVVTLMNFVVGNVQPGVPPFLGAAESADVNGSGGADVFDAVLLSGFLVGNVPSLPQ